MSKVIGFGPFGSGTVGGIGGARPRAPCTVGGTADTRGAGVEADEPPPGL